MNTVLFAVLVGELHLNHEGLLAAIDPRHTGRYSAATVGRVLRAAQWLLLLFLAVQVAALGVALLVRGQQGARGWRRGSSAPPAAGAACTLRAHPA